MHINTHAFSLGCFPAFFSNLLFFLLPPFPVLITLCNLGKCQTANYTPLFFFCCWPRFLHHIRSRSFIRSFLFCFLSLPKCRLMCFFRCCFYGCCFFFFHFSSPCYTVFVFVSLSLPLLFFQGVFFFFSHLRLIQPPLFLFFSLLLFSPFCGGATVFHFVRGSFENGEESSTVMERTKAHL